MKYLFILFLLIVEVFSSPIGNLQNMTGAGNSTSDNQPKRYSDIINFLTIEAEKGNGEYAFYLGNFYLNGSYEKDSEGKVVQKNTDLAIKYFNKAADENFLYGAFTLGSLYLYNEDFIKKPNNLEMSEKYLKKALEIDVFEAYTILGDIYFNYKEDAEKAINYFFKGAEKGVSTSQYALAVVYNTGYKDKKFKLEKNELLSIKYLTDACTNTKKTKKIEELCYNSSLIKKEKIGD